MILFATYNITCEKIKFWFCVDQQIDTIYKFVNNG